jgi:D-alanine-D-alanine ligase
MNVTILYDDVDARRSATADERGVLEAVAAVEAALVALGHAAQRVPVDRPAGAWIDVVRAARIDLAFNLCEGVGGSSAFEPHVVALLELLGVRVTGSPAETLALARRKDRVNALLDARGLPVARWTVAGNGVARTWRDYPAIVKPVAEDASVGITQRSVVRDAGELTRALHDGAAHAPLLVQRFLEGRELNVGVLGGAVLPISEIDFGTMPASRWRLVTYAAKWNADSVEDRGTLPRCPAPIDDALTEQATRLALEAWRLVDGRGYGRVDLRADEADNLHVLEVNPNPDLAPGAGFARMAAAAGTDYVALIDGIVREALQ